MEMIERSKLYRSKIWIYKKMKGFCNISSSDCSHDKIRSYNIIYSFQLFAILSYNTDNFSLRRL